MSIFIGLGSNIGEGKQIISDAWNRLGDNIDIDTVCLSSPYKSAPVGMDSKNWFTNAVGQIKTTLSPLELLVTLQLLESEFGRKRLRDVGYQDRTLDLDLLYYDDVIMNTEVLVLPHPRTNERLFVLTPLEEIAPDFIDIANNKNISKIYNGVKEGLSDEQQIIKESWLTKPTD